MRVRYTAHTRYPENVEYQKLVGKEWSINSSVKPRITRGNLKLPVQFDHESFVREGGAIDNFTPLDEEARITMVKIKLGAT